MGFVNEELEGYKWQTIDRERNIILKHTGGGGSERSPDEFSLNIAGENINFSAYQKIKQLKHGYEIEWQVLAIYEPPHIKQNKSKLHGLITEALDAFGFSASRKNVLSLIVTFAPNI